MGKLDISGRSEAPLLTLGATHTWRPWLPHQHLLQVLTFNPLYAHLPALSSSTCGHSWLRPYTTCTSLAEGETWGLASVSSDANDP